MIVTGKITDETGEGIPADVYLSNSAGTINTPTVGTSADGNGNYSLNVPADRYAFGNDLITADFVGTTKQIKPLLANVNFNLVSNGQLSEVVVTANKINKPKIWPYVLVFLTITGIGIAWYKHAHKTV